MGASPEKGRETRLPQGRPPRYLGRLFCRTRLAPHIPRRREAVARSGPRVPGPPAPPPVTRRPPPPHSKFAAALTHWLAGGRSREAAAQPLTQAEPRPRASPRDALSASIHIRAPAGPSPERAERVVRLVRLPARLGSELLASGVEPLPAL